MADGHDFPHNEIFGYAVPDFGSKTKKDGGWQVPVRTWNVRFTRAEQRWRVCFLDESLDDYLLPGPGDRGVVPFDAYGDSPMEAFDAFLVKYEIINGGPPQWTLTSPGAPSWGELKDTMRDNLRMGLETGY